MFGLLNKRLIYQKAAVINI